MLVAVFGFSFAVAIPFVFAACTIGAAGILVYALAHHWMVCYVTNLVELIGLALAIDYSLLIVHRFREELGGVREADAVSARWRPQAARWSSRGGRSRSASGCCS